MSEAVCQYCGRGLVDFDFLRAVGGAAVYDEFGGYHHTYCRTRALQQEADRNSHRFWCHATNCEKGPK